MPELLIDFITSLDGYVEDNDGKFDWAAPDEEVLAFVTDWIEPWDDYTVQPTRIVEGGDWVMVAATHSGRHRSGTEISMEMYTAGRVRDGKFIELRWFMDEADALRAAGLSE
jgi:ketosteroid isomerase-like protein